MEVWALGAWPCGPMGPCPMEPWAHGPIIWGCLALLWPYYYGHVWGASPWLMVESWVGMLAAAVARGIVSETTLSHIWHLTARHERKTDTFDLACPTASRWRETQHVPSRR